MLNLFRLSVDNIIVAKKYILRILMILLMSTLSSCIYHPEIVQGSIIKKEDLTELKIGMSKEQVQYVLGSPSIINALDTSRWEYIYRVRDRRSRTTITKGYLIFKQDVLAEIHLDEYRQ